MKTLPVFLALLICGCATSSQVRTMIDENNQKVISEQLMPELDRVDEQLATVGAELGSLSEKVRAAEAAGVRADETVLSLSLALNKTQGDIGQLEEQLRQIQEWMISQEAAMDQAAAAVDEQRAALVGIFRKQLAGLQEAIQQLEGEIEMAE